MEVHAHSHTPRKKWTHYFWEFLMLFLAVFCGFLAEYQLEHKIEKDREKQYIQSLNRDLKEDTTFINRFLQILSDDDRNLDTLIELINTNKYAAEANTFYSLALKSRSVWYMEYQKSTFDQLKNSGSLRLLRKWGIADRLTIYNNIMTDMISKHEARLMQATANIASYQTEILDARYFKKQTFLAEGRSLDFYTVDNPVMGKIDENKMKKLKNLYFEKQLLIPYYMGFLLEIKNKARNLLQIIEEKYHLE